MAAKRWAELVPLLRSAVAEGLHGVAVLSPSGDPVGVDGALGPYEVRALAALVSKDGPPDLLTKLFDGELAASTFEHRAVFLGIAGRCVFVIATAGGDRTRARARTADLCAEIEALIRATRARLGAGWVPPASGSDGSGSPPAEAFVWPPEVRRGRGVPN